MDLRTLTSLSGVSGNENEVRSAIIKQLESMGIDYECDVMGNVIAKQGNQGPKVMIDAHMDEVGLVITHIEKNGFLRFARVGGIDPRVLVSKRVLVGKDKIPGVIGAKAIHLQERDERSRVIPIDQWFIDIGAESRNRPRARSNPATTWCSIQSTKNLPLGSSKPRRWMTGSDVPCCLKSSSKIGRTYRYMQCSRSRKRSGSGEPG